MQNILSELRDSIFGYLPAWDLLYASAVCRKWRVVWDNDFIWEKLWKNLKPELAEYRPKLLRWRDLCVAAMQSIDMKEIKKKQLTGLYTVFINDYTTYIGEITNGAITGSGILTSNGFHMGIEEYSNIYYGEINNRRKEGYGEMIWYNKENYKGQWKSGNPHGYGERFFKNGDVYKGEWQTGVITGHGAYYWPDGSKCIGKFYYGRCKGPGLAINSSGYIFNYKFDNRGNSIGDIQYPDGKVYKRNVKLSVSEFRNMHVFL